MSKTKKSPASTNYVKTIRDGAVAANIFRGNTPDGHCYLYFEISRAWKSQSSNREGYSKKFYERNQQALINVLDQACRWIVDHPEAADSPVVEAKDTTLPTAA